jgi:hypothetical protein
MIEIVFSILDGRLTFLLTERHHSIINKLRRNDPKNWAMPKRHVGIRLLRLSMAALLRVGLLALLIQAGWPQTPKPKLEPRIFSIYPLGDQPGVTYEATIRGFMLRDAQAIWFETDGIRARVEKADREPEADPNAATPTDVVSIHVTLDSTVKPGSYPFRVVTKQGITNAVSMRVTSERTIMEVEGSTGEPEHAPRLSDFPLVVNGRIAKKGQVNYYSFETQPGEELSFEVFSGFSPFDPSLTILEPSGSWFDPHRLNRIAFSDEPLWYPDFSTDTRLVHRFEHGGRFLARVEGFEGRGSLNDVYQLRVSTGRSAPALLRALPKPGWQERTFTRHITADWLERLRERGAPAGPRQELETFRAVKEPAPAPPVMKVPGIVEGVISQPGEVQRVAFHSKGAQDLVLEVETPDATMPLFNPVVRVLDSAGHEVATNVYTQLNNCGGYMMKMIEPKAIVAFHADGDYILQIHDITTDNADPSFVYRVLVRPQIPHLGKVEVEEERINLTPGIAKQVSVVTEREEDYGGLVALSVEGLPPGVQAVSGAAPEEEKPPLMNGGRVERYFPKSQKSVLLIMVAPDAPLTPMPQMARVIVRAIVENKVAQPLATMLVPVMVVAASSDTPATLLAPAGKP